MPIFDGLQDVGFDQFGKRSAADGDSINDNAAMPDEVLDSRGSAPRKPDLEAALDRKVDEVYLMGLPPISRSSN